MYCLSQILVPGAVRTNSVAKPEGSYVENKAMQVHWDGAKDEDVLLLIGGEGPATTEFIH